MEWGGQREEKRQACVLFQTPRDIMSNTLDHASSRQIVRDYTQLLFGFKRLMQHLRQAIGLFAYKCIFNK
jgi:hypothetical protein